MTAIALLLLVSGLALEPSSSGPTGPVPASTTTTTGDVSNIAFEMNGEEVRGEFVVPLEGQIELRVRPRSSQTVRGKKLTHPVDGFVYAKTFFGAKRVIEMTLVNKFGRPLTGQVELVEDVHTKWTAPANMRDERVKGPVNVSAVGDAGEIYFVDLQAFGDRDKWYDDMAVTRVQVLYFNGKMIARFQYRASTTDIKMYRLPLEDPPVLTAAIGSM